MRYPLKGRWKSGYAFDLHTLASTYLGPDEFGHERFENTRSEMGELVYRLKYSNDLTAVESIIDLLKPIGGIDKFDVIIPAPSSNKRRRYQPVDEIARALGRDRKVPVLLGFFDKRSNEELKNIEAPAERAAALKGVIRIAGETDISGKKVLLVDDLYRSGTGPA